MKISIVDSSPMAVEAAAKAAEAPNAMYPFADLEVGKSFTIPISECNWKSLRIIVYQKNARNTKGNKYKFLKHDDMGLIEVARIA